MLACSCSRSTPRQTVVAWRSGVYAAVVLALATSEKGEKAGCNLARVAESLRRWPLLDRHGLNACVSTVEKELIERLGKQAASRCH